jgi:hypothetical protein
MKRLIITALTLFIGVSSTNAHPDKVEDRLVMQFATGVHPPRDGVWEDLTHNFKATVKGSPILTNIGPALALKLNGVSDYLHIDANPDRLPRKEFSVSAWVMLSDTMREGSIVGYVQDDGDIEKGFYLGYDEKNFNFLVAAEKEGQLSRLTRIRSKSPVKLDHWQHIVGTYDGTTMRLYVNGVEEATSTQQSGDVAYPKQATLTVGAYLDPNEFYPMDGSIYQTKLYARVLQPEEIKADVERNNALISYRPPINDQLKFVVAPYLQFGTKESMTVMCETTAPARMLVEFGETNASTHRVESDSANLINSVTLSNLKPHTRYFYRVTSTDYDGNIARGEVSTFQTVPDPKSGWAFGIIGDTQRNPEVTRKCADGLFALRPNMLIHCGDVVDDGFAKHQWVSELFEPISKLSAHVPMYPVIGNHEKNAHWYYDYFHLPAPEYFYTFQFGNAQFFMIDSNKDLSPGSEQYRWLEKELKKSKATWKFAAHHHPCFSSDENDYGDHWKGTAPNGYAWGDTNARDLVPLYEKYGVDIAFAGHIHSYERTWPILNMTINQKNGVRYIVSGGGGGGLEQAGPQRSWFTVHVQQGHHYCFATVQGRSIQFKAYDLEGRLFDTFELTKEK